MATISVLDAKERLAELVQEVEAGETIVLTRDGEPVAEIKAHGGRIARWRGAIADFKKKHGVETIFPEIPENFDDPLPEDILLRPLPPGT